jgi:LCP family protein required for cell wall assembly
MWKFLRLFLLVLLALSAGAAGALWKLNDFVTPELEDIKQTISFNEASGTINILLMGLDLVDGVRRTDTIAMVIVDLDRQAVRMMSIPRDTRVKIPRHGWQKINHAFPFGGKELLIEVVTELTNLPVNYYAVINYNSFPAIVNLLGGVDINVEKNLVYRDNAAKLFINIPKGFQHLDGKTALEYVRFRNDALGDIGRIERQQGFMKAIAEKMKTPAILPKLPGLAQETAKMVETNMTPAQAIQLAAYVADIPREQYDFFMMPGKVAYIDRLSYWIPDIPAASVRISGLAEDPEEVGGPRAIEPDSAVVELIGSIGSIAVHNGDGETGLSRKGANILQKIGIQVAYTGNAGNFDYHSTNIQIPPNATPAIRAAAEALATLCGIDKKLISQNRRASQITLVIGHDKNTFFNNLNKINPEQYAKTGADSP